MVVNQQIGAGFSGCECAVGRRRAGLYAYLPTDTGDAPGHNKHRCPHSYLWTTTAGNILGDPATLNPLVDAPGLDVLRASNADNGCIRMDSVVVTENLDAPSLSISTPGLLTCTTVSVQLSAQTPVPGGTFIWTTPDGNISMGNSSPNPIVNQPGYVATATDPLNGCFSRDSIVGSNTQIPVLTETHPILTCAQTQYDFRYGYAAGK